MTGPQGLDDPRDTAAAVRAALRDDVEDLPPAPAAAVKLLRLTRDEGGDVSIIAHLIETEPALAAKVLKIVNSAYYGFPRNIQSIHRAVTLLGLSAVRRAAVQVLFFDSMVRRGGKGAFDRLFFWQHSLLVAILSRGLGEWLGHPDPDSLYAAGLLHDLGKAILESQGRIRYSDFLTASVNSGNPTIEDERTFFGVSHDLVGALVCERWGLPEMVCRVQAMHHAPDLSEAPTQEAAREVAIVAMADFIAWTQGIGSVDTLSGPPLASDVLDLVPLDQIDLATLLEAADAEITEIGGFYGLEFPTSMQLRARMVGTAISLRRNAPLEIGQARSELRASYTLPHHSLDPDEFIPSTLEALREEFGIGSLLMMQIEPKRRSLVATHTWPEIAPGASSRLRLELPIDTLSGDLVRCLRERRPTLVGPSAENDVVLAALGVTVAAVVPVLNNGRLLGVLWLVNGPGASSFDIGLLLEVQRVASELGIALDRSRVFALERARAEIDALTRLSNRAAIDRFLDQVFRQSTESGLRFAVGLVDVDRFKGFNDTFGHLAGDDVLRIVADSLRGMTRPRDFIGRYGGEEFLFVLVDCDAPGALSYAERIRAGVEQRGQLLLERFPGHPLTVSVGVALCDGRGADPAQVVGTADRALYRAKSDGRNRVVPAWILGDSSAVSPA